MQRRKFILGALLAPLALTVGTSVPQVIGADIGAGVGMAIMGDLNGTSFVTVPKEVAKRAPKLVDWLILTGWEISEKQLGKDVIQLERKRNPFDSEVKPDVHKH